MKSRISLLIVFACFFLGPVTVTAQDLVINEVCAANYDDHLDNFGDYEDWLEVYNTTGADIDLNGYYFSDDVAEPMKYQVTASVMVPANGYRVVYLSDRNEIAGNSIHASFKVTQANQEYMVLSDPAGVTIDLWWLQTSNQKNHSTGRLVDGGPDWGVFTNPTPGAANVGGFTGYAPLPVFDNVQGVYAGAVDVNITSPNPDVTIYYELGGDVPDNTSPVAAGPINIADTEVITAVAYSSDPMVLPSFMEFNTYFIGTNHTLPIFSIAGPEVDVLLGGNQIEPEGFIEYFGEDGVLRDEARGEFNKHGNDSWAYDQRGIDYITRDQYGYNNAIHYPIFRTKDRPSFQRLMLKAAANDNYPASLPAGGGAHVIDGYVHALSQIGDLRMDERSHEPCIMYVNGDYWGVYDVREKVDDIDFTNYYYNQDAGEVDFWKTWGGTWAEFDSGTANEWDDLVTYVTTQDMTDPANYQYVKSVYNTGSLIDYFILNSFVVTSDWLNWNTGWWRGRNPNGTKKKWRYILWDNDASFGQYINYTGIPTQQPTADPCDPQTLGNPGGEGHVPILNALLGNEEFYNDYVSRYADLSLGVFSCESMHSILDSLTGMIAPEMQMQCDRWGGTVPAWEANVQEIHDFIDDRCAVISAGIVDCYDVEGPYPLTIEVMPPGAGWVEFNSLEVTDFPWEGQYFGNLDVEMEANPYGVNVFSHWTSNNHMLSSFNTDTTDFTFASQDTITAWFVTETSEITLDVFPPGAGTIEFLGTDYNSFPVNVDAPEGPPLAVEATSSGPYFVFSHWTIENHALDPDDLSNPTNITVDTTDVLTAVFIELDNYNITVQVDPPGSGDVIIDGVQPATYPWNSGQMLGGVTVNIEAIAIENYHFVGWTYVNPLTGADEDVINSFELNADEVLTAHFEEDENYVVTFMVEPSQTGEILVNGNALPEYPHTEKFYEPDLTLSLAALEAEFHDFVKWTSLHNEIEPDIKEKTVTVELMHDDTIVATFMQEIYGYYIPTAFTPNGDGINDLFKVEGHAVEADFYSLEVFDKWGNLMWETTDIDEGWVGAGEQGSEFYALNGVYAYRLKVRSVFDNKIDEVFGHFTLFR